LQLALARKTAVKVIGVQKFVNFPKKNNYFALKAKNKIKKTYYSLMQVKKHIMCVATRLYFTKCDLAKEETCL